MILFFVGSKSIEDKQPLFNKDVLTNLYETSGQ